MNQFLKRRLLNEAMLTFIKAGFLLLLISSEPCGEIAVMIDLLKKFTQLLMNDFALIDYCGEYGGCEKDQAVRSPRLESRRRGEGDQTGIDLRMALSRVCVPAVSVASTRVRIPIGSPAPWVGTGSAASSPRRRSSLTAPEGTNQT